MSQFENSCQEKVIGEPDRSYVSLSNCIGAQYDSIPMRNDHDNLIVKLTIEFTLMIIEYSEILESARKYVIARQVLTSSSGIGANVREAQNAESKADFIHKFKIAAKESDESTYWLTVCSKAKSYPSPEPKILSVLNDIKKIINKIISSSKG